jgi:glucose/arabinose dehydrogenase
MAICLLRRYAALAILTVSALALRPTPAAAAVQLPSGILNQVLVNNMDWPCALAFLPDGRLLVVELKSAKVRMIVNGSIASTDPVAVVDSVDGAGEEQGLYGLAVDPRWPTKPYIYVMYTSVDSVVRVSRLTGSGDLDNGSSGNLSFDPASRRDLIRDVEDIFETHNGGSLRFAPDSMLFVSFAEDAHACLAADSTLLLGVLARLDVRKLPDTPGPPDKALLVPADNPFVNRPNLNTRLQYSRGLRNPFRIHVDQPTGRVFVADVGWNTWDELDVVDTPGLHYGWPFYEGTMPYVTNECGFTAPPSMVAPSYEINRVDWCAGACAAAMIGGVVFRHVEGSNTSFPASYDGMYMFSDYYAGWIWTIRDSSGTWVKAAPVAGQPNSRDWAAGFRQASEYVLGPDGSVYYTINAVDYLSNTGSVCRMYRDPQLAAVERRDGPTVEFGPVVPSPARGSAELSYTLPRAGRVHLTLFDALGRRVRQLVAPTDQTPGQHRVSWDGTDDSGRGAAPGVYVARLNVDGQVIDRRIPLLR